MTLPLSPGAVHGQTHLVRVPGLGEGGRDGRVGTDHGWRRVTVLATNEVHRRDRAEDSNSLLCEICIYTSV